MLSRETVIEVGIQFWSTRGSIFANESTSVVPGPDSLRKTATPSNTDARVLVTRAFSYAAHCAVFSGALDRSANPSGMS